MKNRESGTLVYFCAGVSSTIHLPGKNLEGFLVNVPHAGKSLRSIEKTKTLISESKPQYVMLDSGGFTLLNAENQGKEISYSEDKGIICRKTGVNLVPRHVVQVAQAIGPDILVALDFPLKTLKDPREQEWEFQRKLSTNVSWAFQTAMYQQKHYPHGRLFIPIQCYNLQQLEEYLFMIRDLGYENLCMPVRNLSLMELTEFLLHLHHLGTKRIHILGVGALDKIALAAYMARNCFDWVSLDGTSWQMEAIHNTYLDPADFTRKSLNDNSKSERKDTNECPCPYCLGKTMKGLKKLPYTERAIVLRKHNFWVTNNISKELYKQAGSLQSLKRFLVKIIRNQKKIEELCRCMRRIELEMRRPMKSVVMDTQQIELNHSYNTKERQLCLIANL